jgi:flagellar protein FlbD
MIRLTRLNNIPFYLNPDLIEHVETTPDTLVALTSGQKYMVLESAEEVLERIVALRQRIYEGVLVALRPTAAGGE